MHLRISSMSSPARDMDIWVSMERWAHPRLTDMEYSLLSKHPDIEVRPHSSLSKVPLCSDRNMGGGGTRENNIRKEHGSFKVKVTQIDHVHPRQASILGGGTTTMFQPIHPEYDKAHPHGSHEVAVQDRTSTRRPLEIFLTVRHTMAAVLPCGNMHIAGDILCKVQEKGTRRADGCS